ncbi:MAG: heavy metal-responsive transcriptional regulator [Chloroflexi bacterium]|nr:heavy metal-responsive transcriptional regulator [Chloroflexota bacterium]
MNDQLQIGELARRAGVNTPTIRYYEEIGLLPAPTRSDSGYRLYLATDLAQVEFIRRARALGLSLGEIKEILSCRARGEPPCVYVTQLIHDKIVEVEQRIMDLQQLREELIELEQIAEQQPFPQERETCHVCHILESQRTKHSPHMSPGGTG